MKLADYQKKREANSGVSSLGRGLCLKCLRPPVTCVCATIQPFDPKIKFVILTHLREAQNRIGTGRFSHQILENSHFLVGTDFTENHEVNALIGDPGNLCVILYPGAEAANLSKLSAEARGQILPATLRLVVFVIDGTWFTAPKILRLSRNLQTLPKICFDPPAPSRFRIRRQPKPYCHSTVEAIHHVIGLLGRERGFDPESRVHDRLLHTFDHMVEQQMEYGAKGKNFCQWSPRKAPLQKK